MATITVTLPSGKTVTAVVLSTQNGVLFVRPLNGERDAILKVDRKGNVLND